MSAVLFGLVGVGIVGLAGLCLHWRGKAIRYCGLLERAQKQCDDFQWQLANARHAAKLVRDARSAQASRAAKIGAEKRRAKAVATAQRMQAEMRGQA